MKIVYFGSDDFALAHLRALDESEHEVAMCVTQPDRPRHRGHKMVVSPIKEYALDKGIPVYQPEKFRDPQVIEHLQKVQADLFVVIAYGRILPQVILDLPRIFSINLHGSILPQYRGAAPINRAIIDGQSRTGITIIRMNARMDAGDIIASHSMEIDPLETSQDVRQRMMDEGGPFLIKTIADIEAGTIQLIPQNEDDVTIAAKLDKAMGLVDWTKSAQDLHNLIRGLQPWPGAYTLMDQRRLKLYTTQVVDVDQTSIPGKLLRIEDDGWHISTGAGILLVGEVQMEGARRMPSADFARGVRIEAGYQF